MINWIFVRYKYHKINKETNMKKVYLKDYILF